MHIEAGDMLRGMQVEQIPFWLRAGTPRYAPAGMEENMHIKAGGMHRGMQVEQIPFWHRAGMRQSMRRPFFTEALNHTVNHQIYRSLSTHVSLKMLFWLRAGMRQGMFRCLYSSINEIRICESKEGRIPIYELLYRCAL